MNTELTNNNAVAEEQPTSTHSNVVKDLCFAAWVVQACSRIRGKVTKEQALKMVEDYFDSAQDVTPKVKHGKAAAKKENPERDKFMAWVREQIKEKENRELTTKEVAKFRGKFDYYKRFGPEAPYENAFKVYQTKDKNNESAFKVWLAKNERAKGEQLTEKEITSLKNRWYSRPDKNVEPAIWDNRGRWPVCKLKAYGNAATGIEVALAGGNFFPWQAFHDITKAQQRLGQLDEWMINLREGRTPEEVYECVMEYANFAAQ